MNTKIEEIKNYVASIKEENLKEMYHGHFEHNILEIKKEVLDSITDNKRKPTTNNNNSKIVNIGGSYLQAFSNKENELTLVKQNDGIRKNYFIEKYYYLKGKLVFCSIRKNLWKGQELLWKSEYYFVDDKIHLQKCKNTSKNKVNYLKEMKERKKIIEINLPKIK
ncbi:hypothetical protein [Wenyingzhuangia sp. IMCC45574]